VNINPRRKHTMPVCIQVYECKKIKRRRARFGFLSLLWRWL